MLAVSNTPSRNATSLNPRFEHPGCRTFHNTSFCWKALINARRSSLDHSILQSDVTGCVIQLLSGVWYIQKLNTSYCNISKCLSTTQYLHKVKVTGLHFHAINMTELINRQTNFGHVVLLTNCEGSDIIDSVMRINEHSCTPYMRVVFSMFETAHMYAVHVRWMFTVWYMYAVHLYDWLIE